MSQQKLVNTQTGITNAEAKLLASIDADEVISFLQALLNARSDHPPGDCQQVIHLVQEKLQSTDINTEIIALHDHQPNLIASFPGGSTQPGLLLHAHADTVPAGDLSRWSVDPFHGIIREGKIYGRGAGDDKGSIAAQVMAMVTLARANVQLNGDLQIAIVSDEESGGLNGTHWLHQQGRLMPAALLVGEQTNNHIAIAERVACGIDLTVFGNSAHGAMPWAGENAVLKTAGALTWLREHYFPLLAAKQHPYLPPATLNIGKISGGIQWSIVPEYCKVEMDRRLLPGETREQAMTELQDNLDIYSNDVEPLNFELFSTGEVAANINTSPNDPFVLQAEQALIDLTNSQRPLSGYAQTSDGRWFARDGIPIIIFGPGDPALAHSTDEFIEIQELIEATQFLCLLAVRILKQSPE